MAYFTEQTFDFLSQLASNNQREWFELHKSEYETFVRTPALEFIEDFAPLLRDVSPHFRAIAKKVGGSLMRVQRDTRFSRDKTPYKTNIGIQFRHELGKDVHAPGYYLHIANDECFIGVGIWHPDSPTLHKIRLALVEHEQQWIDTCAHLPFQQQFQLSGDQLSKPPRGFDKLHPLIDDLKRKDFIAIAPLTRHDACSEQLPEHVQQHAESATPFMQFLCKALQVNY